MFAAVPAAVSMKGANSNAPAARTSFSSETAKARLILGDARKPSQAFTIVKSAPYTIKRFMP